MRALGALCGIGLVVGLAPPSSAAESTLVREVSRGGFGWSLQGQLEGRVGNAHKGQFLWETGEDTTFFLQDYRCPRGVDVATNSRQCTLLAFEDGDYLYPTPEEVRTFGPVGIAYDLRTTTTLYNGVGSVLAKPLRSVDLSVDAGGPVQRSVTTMTVRGVTTRYVSSYSSEVAVSGTIAGVDLADPKIQITSYSTSHDRDFTVDRD